MSFRRAYSCASVAVVSEADLEYTLVGLRSPTRSSDEDLDDVDDDFDEGVGEGDRLRGGDKKFNRSVDCLTSGTIILPLFLKAMGDLLPLPTD